MYWRKSLAIIVFFILFNITIFSAASTKMVVNDISVQKTQNCNEIGFFQVKEINNRWCFIDPNGNPFFSTGVCSVGASGNYAPKLGYSPYHETIIDLYGSEEEWANVTKNRLRVWGFNTIGSGDKYIKETKMAYTQNIGLAGDNWLTGEVSDYFSDEWIQSVEDRCANFVYNLSDDPNLIGYFLDNEIHWGPDWRKLTDIFDDYCTFGSSSAGKKVLVDFLKQRYDENISNFNIIWREDFSNFDEILSEKHLGVWPYTVKARNDKAAFLCIVAKQFFKVCYEKIKKYDPNHLILGARFQSFVTPVEVVEACVPYVDVISLNHYLAQPFAFPFALIMQDLLGFVRPTDFLQEFYDISKKPLLISEFYFRAKDSGLPNTKPSPLFMPVVKNQRQRAFCFEVTIKGFINKPYSVGYHWFGYVDQPATGRFDGENSNIGLVTYKDEPYKILINKMTQVNKLAQDSVKI